MSALTNLVNTLSAIPGFGWLRSGAQDLAAKRTAIEQTIGDYQGTAENIKQAGGQAKTAATGKKPPVDNEAEQDK
jgi:hypothetical protein